MATRGKSNRESKKKAEYEIAPKSDPKEALCFYCNTKGHWKRCFPKYLKDLKDGKVKKGSHLVNTDTQPEVVTLVKPDDISLPIRRTSGRVSKPPQFYYGFHIREDKISDSTLSELDEPANYKKAMASPEAAKWKEAMKSKILSMYDN
ncbi:retrotransposon protein, putative, ty1-copia subclass [Tanacetum coccineum]